MRANDVWHSNGFLIGSLTYQLSSETVDGILTLENQIELAPDQTQDLFDFLSIHKKSLEYIAHRDHEEAEDAVRTVFRLIAVYSRKVREGKKDLKPVAITKPNILPTSVPRGSYFTVYQAAQICGATSKQIRAWIRKGKLEALDLPGLGCIIESEKLHQFLYKKALDVQTR
jgi:predicted site-specific integrase-resolvase